MAIITIKAEDIRDPFASDLTLIGEEDAVHCDGGPCGEWHNDEDGELL